MNINLGQETRSGGFGPEMRYRAYRAPRERRKKVRARDPSQADQNPRAGGEEKNGAGDERYGFGGLVRRGEYNTDVSTCRLGPAPSGVFVSRCPRRPRGWLVCKKTNSTRALAFDQRELQLHLSEEIHLRLQQENQ
ncbi:Uncharacterized protein DAT39_019225 [Clarias magur]|uniref:Uncharacterized protein n=1 Tax=Clarias magur TaxID=1594786 RepID=A0A8J4TKR1_CLAMG|nr:Uncharacterized protein DAT39_019225 [Clarias magur]